MKRVGVLGAGVAGLSAARLLATEGVEVEVFDKGRGPGGRISRRRAGSFEFDHGAQYFTVEDAEFAEQVDEWRRRGVVAPWEGRIVASDTPGSFEETGPRERLVGVPGMNAPARDLARDLPVRFADPVRAVRRLPAGWEVETESGQRSADFDQLVVTLPPAQSLPFTKASPTLSRQIRSVVMLPCWTVMVAFDAPVEADFDGAFVNHGPLAWVARNSSKPGRPDTEAWVLHAGPEWSAAHLEDEFVAVEAALVEAFLSLLARETLPEVLHLDAHRWRHALPEAALADRCYHDPDVGLGIAGDWCGGPRVEGAWKSGRILAGRMLGG